MLRNKKLWATMTVALVTVMVLSACAPAPGPTPEPGVKEVTRVVEVTREVPAAERTLKACFIYVGPIGDYGWSHAHNEARLFVENQFAWLETAYAEAVPEADVERFLDRFIVEEGCDVVFTTSYSPRAEKLAMWEHTPSPKWCGTSMPSPSASAR